MKLLNTAVIGAGAIHGCHVNALRQLPNVALRALADIDSVKGLKLALGYQCRFYQDYREMLLDDAIDVVHICTPHFEHKSMILAALTAGKHVFCEKPVGMNSSELVDITRAAEQATGLLGVCYQNRLNPTSLRIRQALDEGELGKMLSIKAVLTWSRSGAYYTQSPWRGRLATEGGSLLYASNCNTTDSPLLMEIHCEQGSLLLNNNTLWRVTPGERVRLTCDDSPDGSVKSYWGLGHQQAIRRFYQAITHPGYTDYTDIREAGKSLTLVEAI